MRRSRAAVDLRSNESDRDSQPQEDPLALLRHAIDRGDLSAANDVLMRSWLVLLEGDRPAQMRQLLESVPARSLARHPLLMLVLGICYYAVPERRAKSWQYLGLATAAAQTKRARADPAERIMLLTAESVALRLAGQVSLANAAARSALRLLSTTGIEDIERIGHLPSVLTQLGRTLHEAGNVRDAVTAFQRGLAEAVPGADDGFGSLAMLAAIPAIDGDVAAAAQRIDQARSPVWEAAASTHGGGYVGLHLRLAEAIVALERFDADTAHGHLATIAADLSTLEGWWRVSYAEALHALVRGEPAAGLAQLDERIRLRAHEPGGRKDVQRVAPVRATLQLALGYVDLAEVTLRAEATAKSSTTQIAAARVALARGRLHAALNELRLLHLEAQAPREQAEALAIEAAVLLRLPALPRLRPTIDRLAALLRSTDLQLPLGLLPHADFARVRSALLERGYEPAAAVHSLLGDVVPLVLTPRERALLEALSEPGATRGSIAEAMHVSLNTVKTQLRLLYRKLGVSTREEALAVAWERHVFQEEDDDLSDLDDDELRA